jgi:hypothetical protein
VIPLLFAGMRLLRFFASLRRWLIAAAGSIFLASCSSPGSLRDDPGFLPAAGTSVAGVPDGLDFDPNSLTAAQCVAWLDQKLQPYIWHGKEKDLALTHGRVTFTDGVCRQYRMFTSPAVRTYHLRQIPVHQVVPASLGPVAGYAESDAVNRNYSFDVRGPWTRKWETWDLATNKVTSRGTVRGERVTFSFTGRAAALQAKAVMARLAELMQAGQGAVTRG